MRPPRRPSAPMVMSALALFISLGGVGYAATGDNFILGQSNNATTTTRLTAPVATNALQVINQDTTAGSTPLSLVAAPNHAALKVNTVAKVDNLNVDRIDDLDSTRFLRNGILQTGAISSGGVLNVTNTGGANGVQGKTGSPSASGVYAENTGGGFALAGRSNQTGGVGVFAEATGNGGRALLATGSTADGAASVTNAGSGPALELHNSSGPPMRVDSSARVANLNADKVDGASFLSNRIVSETQFDHILDVPGFGAFYVDGCDHANVRFGWNSGGPNAYVTQGDMMNPGDAGTLFQGVANVFVSATRPRLFRVIQLARDTGSSTSIATVTLSAHATDCVFAAHATVQPD